MRSPHCELLVANSALRRQTFGRLCGVWKVSSGNSPAASRVITRKTNLFLKIISFIGTERPVQGPAPAVRLVTPNSNYENTDRICSQTLPFEAARIAFEIRKFTIQTHNPALQSGLEAFRRLRTLCKVRQAVQSVQTLLPALRRWQRTKFRQ